MSEINRRRKGEIVRAVFEVLMGNPDGLQARDVIRTVGEKIGLTEYEKGEFESTPGRPRFDQIVRFSTITPVKAGWMTKSKSGTWQITDAGRAAYAQYTEPAQLMGQADRLYRVWKKDQAPKETEQPPVDDQVEVVTAGETAVATLEEARELAWTEVKAHLTSMGPYDFQELVAALLRAMGYHVSWIAPPGPDRGIDIIAHTDPLGASGPRIKVQVKKRTTDARVPVGDVRSFVAVLGDRDIGVFVSANGFTSDALEQTRMMERTQLTLVDLEGLFELWTQHYEQLSAIDRQRLPLEPVYFLAPED